MKFKVEHASKIQALVYLQNFLLALIFTQIYKVIYYADYTERFDQISRTPNYNIWESWCPEDESTNECPMVAFPMLRFIGLETPKLKSNLLWLTTHLLMSIGFATTIKFKYPMSLLYRFVLTFWSLHIIVNADHFVNMSTKAAFIINFVAITAIFATQGFYTYAVARIEKFWNVHDHSREDYMKEFDRNFLDSPFPAMDNAVTKMHVAKLLCLLVLGLPVLGEFVLLFAKEPLFELKIYMMFACDNINRTASRGFQVWLIPTTIAFIYLILAVKSFLGGLAFKQD